MGLGGILQRLKTEGVLKVYNDFRQGTLLDYSGNGNNGVVTNGFFTRNGIELNPVTGAVTIAYNAGLVSSSISMVLGITLPSVTNQDRLVVRRDVGTSTFDWHINTPSLTVYQNGANKSITLPATPIFALGISMPNGVAMSGYINGTFQATYTGVTDLVASTNPIVIGNLVGASCLTNKILRYFVYVTRSLTAAEHAELYYDLQRLV